MSERGSALPLALGIVVILAALSVSLTEMTIGRSAGQRGRHDEVRLAAAGESAAGETLAWMQCHQALLAALPEHPELVAAAGSTPLRARPWADQWEKLVDRSMSAPVAARVGAKIPDADIITNGAQPAMIPAILSEVEGDTAAMAGRRTVVSGCGADTRNGCAIASYIVCLHRTEAGHAWPDGHERFAVFTVATLGDLAADPRSFQRRMVQTIVGTSCSRPFTQALYASDSLVMSGSASTDSWRGGASAYAPLPAFSALSTASTSAAAAHGDVVCAGTMSLRDPAAIHGAIRRGEHLALPAIAAAPAGEVTGAYVDLSGDVTLAGDAEGGLVSYRARTVTGGLCFSGGGRIDLVCEGAFAPRTVRFSPGSTVEVVITQLEHDAQDAVLGGPTSLPAGAGDVERRGAGDVAAAPRRLVFMSYADTGIRIAGDGALAAVVYAPRARITLSGSFQFFGALIARSIEGAADGSFQIHYDESLWGMTLPSAPTLSASGWNLVSLSLGNH